MIKHIFIINPVAGKAKGLKLIPAIRDIFKYRSDEYEIEVTNAPGHAEILAASYSRKYKCRLYSVGGDGTLNEVINGMAGTDSELAIIPCGTGNDFIRSITDDKDLNDVLMSTINSEAKNIDLAKINSRFFINIASVGFDAEVVYNTNKFKKLPLISGSLAYILSVIYSVFIYSGNKLNINIDGNTVTGKFLLVAVANGRYYGGGMQPVPNADLFDGLLDVCMIEPVNIFKILAFFPRLIRGTHGSMKEVTFLRGRKIVIESSSDICINADGEISRGKLIDFEIQKTGISVVIPVTAELPLAEIKKSS